MLLIASVGCGLAVRGLAGELRPILIAPAGFALVVVICAFATSYGWLAAAAGPAVVVATVAGYAWHLWTRSGSTAALGGDRGWRWPLIASVLAFAAVGGPVFLTGAVGWTGYTRIVDIAFQIDFAQHLADAGRALPTHELTSSYGIVIGKLLNIGYPGGGQAVLGVMAKLVGTNVAWCYQALLAFEAAMGAIAIFFILGLVTDKGLLRCAGAVVAIQPNILYGYTLEAGIKELTTAVMLITLIAALAERLPGEGPLRRVVTPAIAASGAFAGFSLGVAPWLGLLLVLAFGFALATARRGRRARTLLTWTLLGLLAAAISFPGIVTAVKLATVAGPAVGGVVNLGLGNLAAPVSRWSSLGVWLTSDYRYPAAAHTTASHVFDLIALALAIVGAGWAVWRRRWVLVAVAVTTPIAVYYFIHHSGPWIQLKAFTITSALVVMLAFAGVAALTSTRRLALTGAGWLGALALGGAILYGNAVIYHDTTLAPGARYRDLAAIGRRYERQGPTLDPAFDEYAEYFLRGEEGSSLVDPSNLTVRVRPGVPELPGEPNFYFDLNQLQPEYIQGFHLIVQPRSPTATRPPANYDLVQQTRYFDVWRRDRPAATVPVDLPLSSAPHERTPAFCRQIVASVRRAGPGAMVAYAISPVTAVVNPVEASRPHYWRPLGPGTIDAAGRGTLTATVRLGARARYGIWMGGSIGRPLQVYLDGHRVAKVGYEERYPDQVLLLGSITAGPGTHVLRITRGNGSLHPGSGDPATELASRTFGSIVFAAEEGGPQGRLYVAPASRAAQVCAAPVGYEWMEALKAGGAPTGAAIAPG